ncbi:hypothetical protein [Flavobacterium sp. NKUCC04_CG]|uniref:hypothetical protein n=1 Tax=Flavobacterium sp. NKUCC04_CG TaxID=2842121 RepID=UPI001C5A7B71|nr:hypothetical protein [Flavobacterium sp. NKUCC04_CG]MBW3519572.1 hypothetical protein [Flavobacterium sp. NKUCC04_CG]
MKFVVLILYLAVLTSCSDKKCDCEVDKISLIQEYKTTNKTITLNKIEQGAFGETINLRICDGNNSLIEEIHIRGEDSKPKLDSVFGKNLYISYIYPSSIHEEGEIFEIPFNNVVLGDGLFNKDVLKFKYFFSGRYIKEM